ncbi:FMN-dependent NADH-azoreductase [soil metagenome]
MKLLHLDSSITGEGSVSRKLSADIVSRLRTSDPALEVTYRDLVADPLGHLTLADMPAPGGSTPVLDEFLASDVIVIGASMYNFSVPGQLKAWIDRILIPGKTFSYGEAGVTGLAGEKRVIVAVSRGGFYGAETPMAGHEHLETYLKAVFEFIGAKPEFVIAEGILVSPEYRDAAMAGAEQAITALAA